MNNSCPFVIISVQKQNHSLYDRLQPRPACGHLDGSDRQRQRHHRWPWHGQNYRAARHHRQNGGQTSTLQALRPHRPRSEAHDRTDAPTLTDHPPTARVAERTLPARRRMPPQDGCRHRGRMLNGRFVADACPAASHHPRHTAHTDWRQRPAAERGSRSRAGRHHRERLLSSWLWASPSN